MTLPTNASNPTPTEGYKHYFNTMKQKFTSASTGIQQRFEAFKAQLPAYKKEIETRIGLISDKIPLSTKRYANFMWSKNAGKFVDMKFPYEKNILEKIGDLMLWGYTRFPKIAKTYSPNPIVVGVTSTLFAMSAVKFIFQSIKTASCVGRRLYSIGAKLPRLTYLLAQLGVIGMGCRSIGRETNEDLMDKFNGREPRWKRNTSVDAVPKQAET